MTSHAQRRAYLVWALFRIQRIQRLLHCKLHSAKLTISTFSPFLLCISYESRFRLDNKFEEIMITCGRGSCRSKIKLGKQGVNVFRSLSLAFPDAFFLMNLVILINKLINFAINDQLGWFELIVTNQLLENSEIILVKWLESNYCFR